MSKRALKKHAGITNVFMTILAPILPQKWNPNAPKWHPWRPRGLFERSCASLLAPQLQLFISRAPKWGQNGVQAPPTDPQNDTKRDCWNLFLRKNQLLVESFLSSSSPHLFAGAPAGPPHVSTPRLGLRHHRAHLQGPAKHCECGCGCGRARPTQCTSRRCSVICCLIV